MVDRENLPERCSNCSYDLFKRCLSCFYYPNVEDPTERFECKRCPFDKNLIDSRWINVENSIPEFDKDVLIYSQEGYMCVANLESIVTTRNSKLYNWRSSIDRTDMNIANYWMPLPEKPII